MNRLLIAGAALMALVATGTASLAAEESPESAQETLDRAATEQRYTFLLFYREDNTITRTMAQTVKSGLAKRPGAAAAYVLVTDVVNKPLVDRFGLSRAPMPIVVAVAPNGAMTGIFSAKITEEQVLGSFVTPAMANCMKAMQGGKLALLCVQSSPGEMPKAAAEFLVDPQFSTRVVLVSLPAHDPIESEMLKELGIDVQQPDHARMVFMAPPGVMVGKFAGDTAKDEMIVALHKAGKCCDNPNCNHGKAAVRR